jgi:protein required for attachment to host cells
MYRACIAVVDASRARLFSFERSQDPEGMQEKLIEERDLVNPARRLRTSQLFTDSGSVGGRTGTRQFGLDDHRGAHVDELDAEFSRLVTEQLEELVRARAAQRVILCASPNMLGVLREVRRRRPASAIPVDEISRDLVKLTPAVLRTQLASYGVLPEAERR